MNLPELPDVLLEALEAASRPPADDYGARHGL